MELQPLKLSIGNSSSSISDSTTPPSSSSLFSPVTDFWLLGGISFVILPLVLMIPESMVPIYIGATFFLANWINHPHFAHSYQIFYRSFKDRIADTSIPSFFRFRYLFAGVIAPMLLAAYLFANYQRQDLTALGLTGNLMGFLVGWHYVKQGYGMLIVQSVLKKWYFGPLEKKILTANAYCCWIASYLLLNYRGRHSKMWGVEYITFEVNRELLIATIFLTLVTTVASVLLIARKIYKNRNNPPINGIMAYGVTLYIWIFAALQPRLLFIIPALHSLQYLVVVWRFEKNLQNSTNDGHPRLKAYFGNTARKRFWRFIVVGVGLGYMGFWLIPNWIRGLSTSELSIENSGIMLFLFWIFINIHHYLLDNVMWRKENPDTGKHLFASSNQV